ncbi:MAG: PstS family phosphate ABC transporter substrate-binding protein [Steroidobacterales bacterium]
MPERRARPKSISAGRSSNLQAPAHAAALQPSGKAPRDYHWRTLRRSFREPRFRFLSDSLQDSRAHSPHVSRPALTPTGIACGAATRGNPNWTRSAGKVPCAKWISPACGARSVIVCAALWLAGCHAADAASPAPRLAGVVRCAGGSTMLPLVESWGREFHELHPQAVVEVDPRVSLAAGGFRELLDGRVDLVDFVREPFPSEIAAFTRKFRHAPLLINVANGSFDTRGGTHAIAIYVNSSNPLRHLTLGQLDEIFSAAPRRGTGQPIGTWSGVGLQGKWAPRPIHVYGMAPLRPSGNPPGIVNFMEIRVLQGGTFRTDLRIQRDRPGTSALQAIVRAVANDPDGIGYSGFGYATPGVKTVALAEYPGAPYVKGGAEQIADRSYALSRQIYFALNSPPGHPLPPLLKAFIELVLSPEGQRRVSGTPDRFLPLTPAQSARSRQLIRQTAPAGRAPPLDIGSSAASAPYLTANGAISIVGYNDMREMLESLDVLFEQTHPGTRFLLTLKGTRTAPAALATGRSLLAPMGAVFSPEELAAYRQEVGSDPIAFRIAHDSVDPRARSAPLAIFVPAANPLSRLDFARLKRIFAGGGGKLSWGQLGVEGALADRPVHPYGLAASTALGRFMRRHALAGQSFDKQFRGLSESADVVRQVGNDPLGIGFAAMNRATPAVRIVPLSRREGEHPSRGTRKDLLAGRYPLDRYLLIYVRVPPGGRLDPIARDYLRLALSPAGQRAIASGRLGYLPLNAAEAATQRATLQTLP